MSTLPTNKLSNTFPQQVVPAANADQLGAGDKAADLSHTATGWDSYDVWRKFIKEAREKRLVE